MAPTVPQDQTNGGASDAPVDMVVSDDATKKTKRSASEKKKKSDVDYDKLEKDIAEHTGSVAKDHAKHAQAIEALLALEKTYRLQADLKATSMCCVAVVQVSAIARVPVRCCVRAHRYISSDALSLPFSRSAKSKRYSRRILRTKFAPPCCDQSI